MASPVNQQQNQGLRLPPPHRLLSDVHQYQHQPHQPHQPHQAQQPQPQQPQPQQLRQQQQQLHQPSFHAIPPIQSPASAQDGSRKLPPLHAPLIYSSVPPSAPVVPANVAVVPGQAMTSMGPSSSSTSVAYHHPLPQGPTSQLLPSIIGQQDVGSNTFVSNDSAFGHRRARSTSMVSLNGSPSVESPYPTISPVVDPAFSAVPYPQENNSVKRRPTRMRTASTGSNGSVASSASLSSTTPELDALGRKKPKVPRNPTSWDPHDDLLLRHLKEQQKLGWKDIASHFTNRTPNACQFRWRRLMSGSLRGGPISSPDGSSSSTSGTWTNESSTPVNWDHQQQYQKQQSQQQQQQQQYHLYQVRQRANSPPLIPATTTRPLLPPPELEVANFNPISSENIQAAAIQQHQEQQQQHIQQNQQFGFSHLLPHAKISSPPQQIISFQTQSGSSESSASSTPALPSSLSLNDRPNGVVYADKTNININQTSSKAWTQEEDDLINRKDLRMEELSVLLPNRTENEIEGRVVALKGENYVFA
ncbi:hypothetical protein V1514DRAFT_330360 [Lipomyces japonicus]|uniref:uncharacterized protein n=1 Tax=Lipomyces japonicus TaxID=56871 RepID=UPI0034CF289E